MEREPIWDMLTEITLDDMACIIVAEAKHRLECDSYCPGGLNSKIHGVSMELTLKLCDIMKDLK